MKREKLTEANCYENYVCRRHGKLRPRCRIRRTNGKLVIQRSCKLCARDNRRAKRDSQSPEEREAKLAPGRERERARRRRVIKEYGNCCACCGETEYKFLCIDHVNNDGAAHRKKANGPIYLWLIRHGFPKEGFQILCYNCNCSKGFWGACPHSLRG